MDTAISIFRSISSWERWSDVMRECRRLIWRQLNELKVARETVNSHCGSTHLIFSLLSLILRIASPLWLPQGILEYFEVARWGNGGGEWEELHDVLHLSKEQHCHISTIYCFSLYLLALVLPCLIQVFGLGAYLPINQQPQWPRRSQKNRVQAFVESERDQQLGWG